MGGEHASNEKLIMDNNKDMEPSFIQSPTLGKAERYRAFLPQLAALLEGETDPIACLANTCAALREAFGFFWVGFYLVKNDELVLGPFQGPSKEAWRAIASRKDEACAAQHGQNAAPS